MSKIDDIKKQNQLLQEQAELKKNLLESDRRYGKPTMEAMEKLSSKILDNEKRIKKLKDLDRTGEKLSLEKQIEKLSKSGLNSMRKKLSLSSELKALQAIAATGDKEQIKKAKKYSSLLDDINSGNKDISDVLNTIATEDFGKMNKNAEILGELLSKFPDIMEDLGKEKKFGDMLEGVADKLTGINLKETFSLAGIVGLATDFLLKAKDIRQELGTSAVDSAKLAGNMQIASVQAFLLGGSTEQAASAVTSLSREFGSLDTVTPRVARQAASITAQFGIGGENLGKLTKQMSVLNGASLETNINTLETVGNLARAARVAPADVLNDMAESTELFAKFSMDGGKNLARAAIEARKLGLNLSAVDKIAESILSFEESIEAQMTASVLLGRQINLDKARELALSGDLEGVLAEVKNQVGGAEALSRMNVVQRKALADAVGLEVSELSKLAANQEKVTALVSNQNMQLLASFGKFVGIAAVLGAIIGMITLGAATVPMAGGALTGGLIGAGAGLTGFLAMKGAQKMNIIPKAQTGGTVRETGMAVVHKGESIAGTQFGGRESNNLLKELIKQNSTLMGRLTNKVGDLALSS
jgi:hypothetical protein|tara:strand:+ start:1127 stop:2887 length:1761 start_codon:yes stop_codon:yes gene_type:complete